VEKKCALLMVIPLNIIAFIVILFSQNVNYIKAHNKILSHVRFVKILQQKTTYFKQLSIDFFLGIVIHMMCLYSYH
jgi:hypothetical protein